MKPVTLFLLPCSLAAAGWQAAAAATPERDSMFECKIEHLGKEITLHYRRDGTPLSESEVEPASDPLARQLAAVLAEQATDLQHNCAQVSTIEEYGQPVFGYDCSVARVEAGVETHVTPEKWYWWKDLGQGYRISLNPGGAHALSAGAKLLPEFSQRQPILWIEGPRGGTDRNFGRNGVWQYRVAVEVRVGRRVFRQWAASNVMGSMEWSAWPQLLDDPGDISISIYDTQLGVLHQSELPRSIFDEIESRVQADVARFYAAQQDPIAQCRLSRGWEGGPEIIVF